MSERTKVYRIRPAKGLSGSIRIPGDKSVTHRAFLLGALASGDTIIRGANVGDDCLRTIGALRKLGAQIHEEDGTFTVSGLGGEFRRSEDVLDMGNSGTGTRLLAGLLAGQPFTTTVDGDESLRTRPMGRVVTPLRQMGAVIDGRRDGTLLPLTIEGRNVRGIEYTTPVASAQVKSAVLLAGLLASGETVVTEPAHSRDHTEKMIEYFGGDIEVRGLSVRLKSKPLRGAPVDVGGDPSSAAFLLVAGLIVPGAEVTVEGLLDNPTRTAFLDVLERMGGNIEREGMMVEGPERCLRVTARHGQLGSAEISGSEVPALIDEIPVLAVAGAFARGTFRVDDAAELRVKESDRIAKTVEMLSAFKVEAVEHADGFLVRGVGGGKPPRGGRVTSGGDHRIAMAAATAALAARGKSVIGDVGCVGTSFPEFVSLFEELGAGGCITEEEGR